MTLKLLEFIKNNSDWESLLSQKPYSLSIKRDSGYILFMYNQIESDFSNPIVREARGIIFWEETFEPVCVPFFKFFNVKETNAAKLDWSGGVSVQEKLDGSIMKLWYHNGSWHVSTNGTIDAKNASLQMSFSVSDYYKPLDNYLDLFVYAQKNNNLGWRDSLDKGYTYIFEIVSPFNRVVIPYSETKLYHIGSRNNYNLWEEDFNIGIEKPKTFGLNSLEECLQAAEILPFSEEGYVAVDWRYNRVKIKSPAYVAAHHLKNNGVITNARIFEMIKTGGSDDFLSIYPEYEESFNHVLKSLIAFVDNCVDDLREAQKMTFESRKDFAMWAKNKTSPPVMFLFYDERIKQDFSSLLDWMINDVETDRVLTMIGVK